MTKETEKVIKLMKSDNFSSMFIDGVDKEERIWVEIVLELCYGHKDVYFSEDLTKDELKEIIEFRLKQLDGYSEIEHLKNILRELKILE